MRWFFAALLIPLIIFLAFGAWEAAARYGFTAAFVGVILGVAYVIKERRT